MQQSRRDDDSLDLGSVDKTSNWILKKVGHLDLLMNQIWPEVLSMKGVVWGWEERVETMGGVSLGQEKSSILVLL